MSKLSSAVPHTRPEPELWHPVPHPVGSARLEAALLDDGSVAVRDSRRPQSPALQLSRATWSALWSVLPDHPDPLT